MSQRHCRKWFSTMNEGWWEEPTLQKHQSTVSFPWKAPIDVPGVCILDLFSEDDFVETLGCDCVFLQVWLCTSILFGNEISQLFCKQVDGATFFLTYFLFFFLMSFWEAVLVDSKQPRPFEEEFGWTSLQLDSQSTLDGTGWITRWLVNSGCLQPSYKENHR